MQKAVHYVHGKSFIILFIILAVVALTIVAKEVTTEPKGQYHTVVVKKGDTLWKLASKYQGSNILNKRDYINWIEKLNHLSSSTIYAGQEIVIPSQS